MALTETVIPNESVAVRPNGILEVLEVALVFRDGVEISRVNRRYVLAPGSDLAGKHESIVDLAKLSWTPEKIEAYKEAVKAELQQFGRVP